MNLPTRNLYLALWLKNFLIFLFIYILGVGIFLISCSCSSNSSTQSSQPLVTLETVPISNMGNESDTETGYGKVDYNFAISKYLITVGQYVTFLNATASVSDKEAIIDLWNIDMEEPASYVSNGFIRRAGSGTIDDPYIYTEILDENLGSKSSQRGMPNITWFSAARFANWMHNGATLNASTELGAYNLNYATSGVFIKEPNAKWWIPTEDEWYKAAYYDPRLNNGNGGYYKFPTQSDLQPISAIPTNETNTANYDGIMPTKQKVTPVGSYPNSPSYYGTYDQGGLLWQWNDAIYRDHDGVPITRGMRGGSWSLGLINISKYAPRDYPPTYQDDDSGFRLATIIR